MLRSTKSNSLALLTASTFALLAAPAVADGTEALGPATLAIAPGSGIQIAGIGLREVASGTISIDIPAGSSVEQAILYWEGFAETVAEQGATDDIVLNGAIGVTGERIGGPTNFFPMAWSSTYRADITALGLVGPGMNAIDVSGLDFQHADNGAGLLVILDDGSGIADIQLRDGDDTAFFGFAPPLDTTAPVIYNFAPAAVDRVATLGMFLGSVSLEDPSGVPGRPSVIEIAIDNVVVETLNDALNSVDGNEWDSLTHAISIPAGASSLSLQCLSADSGVGPFAGNLPASLVWVASGFVLPIPTDDGGGEGCTPGYWKQPHHFDSWLPTGYAPGDSFDEVFGVTAFPGMTLVQVLSQGGGQIKALGRHAVAALLNSVHSDVSYGLSEAEVLTQVHDAIVGGSKNVIRNLKNELDDLNNEGCPLN